MHGIVAGQLPRDAYQQRMAELAAADDMRVRRPLSWRPPTTCACGVR